LDEKGVTALEKISAYAEDNESVLGVPELIDYLDLGS
jgi:hypothetical protein